MRGAGKRRAAWAAYVKAYRHTCDLKLALWSKRVAEPDTPPEIMQAMWHAVDEAGKAERAAYCAWLDAGGRPGEYEASPTSSWWQSRKIDAGGFPGENEG